MEKMCRKAVVYIIVLTLVVGNLSVPMKVEAIETNPSTINEEIVISRIMELAEKLDLNSGQLSASELLFGSKVCQGRQFTVTGSACGHDTDKAGTCSNCAVNSIVQSNKWFEPTFGYKVTTSLMPKQYSVDGKAEGGGRTCYGFANFALWFIGKGQVNDKVVGTRIGTARQTFTKENLQNLDVRIGDVIRLGYYDKVNKRYQGAHSVVFLSFVGESGIRVLDCNSVNKDKSKIATVKIHNISYGISDNYTHMAITRAANYVPDANIEVQNYDLKLDPNGGRFTSGSTATITASPQLKYRGFNWNDLSCFSLSRDGYEFAGWYTEPTGGVKVYGPDHIACYEGTYWDIQKGYMYQGDLTVYAHWNAQADNPSKDTTPPTITNVHVDVDNSGYTISCTATDNVGIDRVQFPTWTTPNGQDDLISDYWINERARGTKNGDTYTYRVNISDHNNEYGVYTTHIYAYDAAGNYIFVGANSINVSEPAKINLPDSKSSDSSTTARANVLSYAESLLGWNNASFTEAGRSDIPSGDWSAWFLSLCGERVGIGNLFSTKTDVSEFCTDMIRSHGAQGFYYTDSSYITDADKSVLSGAQAVTKSTFTPQPGDIYILHENGYSGISQVGMIKEAQNGVVKVIVGHNGSALEVQYRDGTANVFYQWNHSKCPIIGYIRPDYASLDVQNYTLYLNPNGGRYANGSTTVVEAFPQLISKGFSCNDLSTYIPSREGYEFTGWYTEPAGGVKVYGSDHVACYEGTYWDLEKGYIYPDNLTVYAQWNKLNVLADLSGNVVISGNLKYGDTLTATVTDSNNTGDLRYQWLRGTAEISEANKGTYKLVQEDIGKKISCVVTSTVERGSISSSAAGVVQKADDPAAPNELSSVTTSAKGASDGKITGVKAGMEYATKADFSDAEAVAGTEITGLKAGTYYVRVAETDTVKAGTAVNVVVSEGTSVGLKGDINGDGTVNAKDRMYLARALAGWDGYTVPDVEQADFNVDGAVNAKDRMYLARKLAGWEGYE